MLFFYPTFMKHFYADKKAFSLLEIVIVIMIVAALAGMTLPNFSRHIEKNIASEAITILSNIRNAEIAYEYENNGYTANFAQLDITIPNSTHYTMPPVLDISNPIPGGRPIVKIARANASVYSLGIFIDGVLCCEETTPGMCQTLSIQTTCP